MSEPYLRHPQCHCHIDDVALTKKTFAAVEATMIGLGANCQILDLCDASAIIVLMTAACSLLHQQGHSPEQADKIIEEALAVTRRVRDYAPDLGENVVTFPGRH